MNKTTACLLFRRLFLLSGLAAVFLNLTEGFAAITWSGANSGTDINWSDGLNWAGNIAPGSSDDVKFFDAGAVATVGTVNNTVDSLFGGTIASLQYGNTNNFHTTSIASGTTLNITGAGGLVVGTPGDVGVVKNLTNSITGAGATLSLNNSSAVISLAQGTATSVTGARANLVMSNLDNFVVNIYAIGIGSVMFPNPGSVNQREAGLLVLAKTNTITLGLTDTLANYQTAGRTNALEMVNAGTGNNSGIMSFLYLGISNAFNVDSIGVGRDKASASSAAWMGFNPVFLGSSPSAYFRGVSGGNSRITWWGIGDMNANGSSAQVSYGTNDFSGGTVDAMVNVMSLARDTVGSQTSASASNVAVLTFNLGTINVNTLYVGNQSLGGTGNTVPSRGTVNVSGPNAKLIVNSSLVLARTNVVSAAAAKTSGALNVLGGTVWANTISRGSITNAISLGTASTLTLTNTCGDPALPIQTFNITNSTLNLFVGSATPTNICVTTLNTGGTSNSVNLLGVAVFPSYPRQIPLISYVTGINGAGYNFGITNPVPSSAPGAFLSNNVANKTIDLYLPYDPRPVITANPNSYSGNPNDNVTFSVSINPNSVTPLGYQWFYVTGNVTNSLANGAGPSGSSTLTGATSATLSLNNAQPGDNGSYFVVVTNIYGTNTSSQAVLTISAGCVSPGITGPNNQTVIQGNDATFTASVTGNPAPSIQWQLNGVDISGATTSSLVVTNVQYPADNGAVFSIIATNSCGNVTNSATLSVIVPPSITSQPTNLVVTNTQQASFTVVASGVPAPGYQWKKNGSPISGATSATYTIANAAPADIASYSCTITNQAGTTNTVSVILTVNSTMSVAAVSPTNSQTGVYYDTPLYLTLSDAPVMRTNGTIKIFNVTNTTTPVDTINLALNSNGVQAHTAFSGDSSSFNYYPVVITGNTIAIYPHGGVMTSNQTYYVTVDGGAFADATGAYFVGIATNAWQFTTKVTGPADPVNPVVNSAGGGDFATVQGAVDSLPVNAAGALRKITIKNGTYFEIVDIGKSNLILRGQSRGGAIIKYPNNASIAPGGSTHGRMTFKVNANDVTLDNLTITNSTPQGGTQAEALMLESNGKRCLVNNCEIDSRQDTILANGSSQSTVYFHNSKIVGNFDYIWGGGACYFEKCVIHNTSGTGGGNLTAARTDTSATQSSSFPWPNPSGTYSADGVSFVNCIFEADAGLGNITLAGSNGTSNNLVAWSSCQFATNYVAPSATLFNGSYLFWQYQNTDSTGTNALSFGVLTTIGVTNNDPRLMAATNVTTWLYGWVPALAPNITSQPTNLTVTAGSAAVFSVTATAIPDATYQWLQNGTNSPYSANSSTLTIPSAQTADAGSYSVVIANSAGSVTSSVVTLTVNIPTPPTLNGSPQLQNDGNIQISFSGSNGSAYRVWASTNLMLTPITSTWDLVSSGTFGASAVTFTDSNATNYPQRFYIISTP